MHLFYLQAFLEYLYSCSLRRCCPSPTFLHNQQWNPALFSTKLLYSVVKWLSNSWLVFHNFNIGTYIHSVFYQSILLKRITYSSDQNNKGIQNILRKIFLSFLKFIKPDNFYQPGILLFSYCSPKPNLHLLELIYKIFYSNCHLLAKGNIEQLACYYLLWGFGTG